MVTCDLLGLPSVAMPTLLSNEFKHPSLTILTAHGRCRDVEKILTEKLSISSNKSVSILLNKELINVRILGFLLQVGPSDAFKARIAKSILSCETDEKLIQYGEFYDKHFIRLCTAFFDNPPIS